MEQYEIIEKSITTESITAISFFIGISSFYNLSILLLGEPDGAIELILLGLYLAIPGFVFGTGTFI